jgi:integrase
MAISKSVKQRPNGMWRARYRDPDTGREHAKHERTKRAADAWLEDQIAALVTGTYVDPRNSRVTLAAYFEEWAARQVWADGTATAMSLAIRTCSFADQPLGKIRRSHVETWIKSMTTAGLAPGTIRTRLNNVRSVLRAAVRDRLLPRDPSDGASAPRQRRAEAAMTIPTPDQVHALLEAAREQWHVYLAVAAFSGLRLGEVSALQLGDLELMDLQRASLHVRRQVQRAKGGRVVVTPPKYGSERTVHIPEELATLLAAHASEGTHGAERWLFTSTTGDPPHQNTVGYAWRATAARAAVEGFTLHDLRHFFASGLIAAGCDVVTVQRALGHAKATTTLNTYSHLWPTAEDRTRAAAGELMRSSRGPIADSRPSADSQAQ